MDWSETEVVSVFQEQFFPGFVGDPEAFEDAWVLPGGSAHVIVDEPAFRAGVVEDDFVVVEGFVPEFPAAG